jgi:hypothetical protein
MGQLDRDVDQKVGMWLCIAIDGHAVCTPSRALDLFQSHPVDVEVPSAAAENVVLLGMWVCVGLQICDVVCQGHPETRSVDLHGLSLTATTQNFLQRNEVWIDSILYRI